MDRKIKESGFKDLENKRKEVDRLVDRSVAELRLRRFISGMSLIILIVGMFFFASSITGNSIGSSDVDIFGAILIVIGVVGLFAFLRRKK